MKKHSREYDTYMKSEAWAKRRAERLALDDNKCAMCDRPNGIRNGKPILQVHHISYDRLGNEDMADLVSLCPSCHKKIHKYYRRLRTWEDKQVVGAK